jgi:mannosyltransferase OCH1-like enzyme
MAKIISTVFSIICLLAAFFPQAGVLADQTKSLTFDALMMPPTDQLSSKDTAELQEIERDYNRDIKHLCRTPLRHVPKVIHFIWIGPRSFPKNSIDNLKSWKRFHPHWKICFWTDSKKRPLPISGMTRKLIQKYDFGPFNTLIASTDSWAEKSDLIRYMILYNEGGIYVDHDVEALRSFSPFVNNYDFVVGLEWFNYHPRIDSCVSTCNALIISRKKHPVMRGTIDRILQCWDEIGLKFPGKDFFSSLQRVISRTFDSMVISAKNFRNLHGNRDLILPNSYFYPYPAFDMVTTEKLREAGYVYAIHKYDGTWKGWNEGVSLAKTNARNERLS